MEKDTDKILSNFLRNLASDIEENKLKDKDLQKIGEFYISWLYEQKEENKHDLYKFLTMGWYVYETIK